MQIEGRLGFWAGAMNVQGTAIDRGCCYATFIYDAARSIALDAAESRLQGARERQSTPRQRRAPSYFEYRPPPLAVTQQVAPIRIGTFESSPGVEILFYDFGAVAATYAFDIAGPLENLLTLSENLYDNRLLFEDSRRRVAEFVALIGDAALRPQIAAVVEDYAIFHIQALSEAGSPVGDVSKFCEAHDRQIAQILRAERVPLSEEEVRDALSARVSYSKEDIAIVDWNAALLIDAGGDDVLEVLQFANVELLEMRYLDQRLDSALDQSYEILSHRKPSAWWPRRNRTSLRAVAELKVDNAALFEGVNNAVKLLGDQYLARAYRVAGRRLHLDDWDNAILRKLEALDSVYQILSDQASTRRMETLEWIVILLIVLSIALEVISLRPY